MSICSISMTQLGHIFFREIFVYAGRNKATQHRTIVFLCSINTCHFSCRCLDIVFWICKRPEIDPVVFNRDVSDFSFNQELLVCWCILGVKYYFQFDTLSILMNYLCPYTFLLQFHLHREKRSIPQFQWWASQAYYQSQ